MLGDAHPDEVALMRAYRGLRQHLPLLHTWEDYVTRTEAVLAAAEAEDHTYV